MSIGPTFVLLTSPAIGLLTVRKSRDFDPESRKSFASDVTTPLVSPAMLAIVQSTVQN
jgi:hypothetical protein